MLAAEEPPSCAHVDGGEDMKFRGGRDQNHLRLFMSLTRIATLEFMLCNMHAFGRGQAE